VKRKKGEERITVPLAGRGIGLQKKVLFSTAFFLLTGATEKEEEQELAQMNFCIFVMHIESFFVKSLGKNLTICATVFD
jgi:hypothetical protein